MRKTRLVFPLVGVLLLAAAPAWAQRAGRVSVAADVGVIVDGTDNFAARFLITDYAVKSGTPWVFAGCIRAEWQTMAVLPGRSPCLRCSHWAAALPQS